MRLVESADFATNVGRVQRDLMEQPRIKRRGPGHEGRLQRMCEAGAGEVLGDLEVGVASRLVFQRVEQLAGHDHHLAVVMLLCDVEQRPVALGFEYGVVFRAACRHARDETLLRELRTEALQHFGIEVVAEIKDVPCVRIEHEDHLHAVMRGALLHPAHALGKAVPVGFLIFKRQQRGHAEAGLGGMIHQFLLARVGPDRFIPRGGRLEVCGIRNEGAVVCHARSRA